MTWRSKMGFSWRGKEKEKKEKKHSRLDRFSRRNVKGRREGWSSDRGEEDRASALSQKQLHPFPRKRRTVLRIVLIRGCQCDSLWRSREGWLDDDEDERRQETSFWLRSRGWICRWRREMTGKNSCQTIRHHPARVPSSSSFVSLLPRASAPPPSLPFALTRSNRGIPRIRGRSMNLFCRRDDRIREWDAPEKNILENRVLKIQSFFLLIRSRKSLFYFEILFSENFIRAMKLWIWKENARIEEGMIRSRKKKKRKKGSRAALLIELAKD